MTAIALNEAVRLAVWRTQDLDALRDFLYKSQRLEAEFGKLMIEAGLREEWRQERQGEICASEALVLPLDAK